MKIPLNQLHTGYYWVRLARHHYPEITYIDIDDATVTSLEQDHPEPVDWAILPELQVIQEIPQPTSPKLQLHIGYEEFRDDFDYEDGEWDFVSADRWSKADEDQRRNWWSLREVGRAFSLDLFDHSAVVWSLSGDGPECEWDTSHNAGLLVYLGTETNTEEIKKWAADYCKYYTKWCNGEVYYWALKFEGEVLESSGDIYDEPGAFEYLTETLQAMIPTWELTKEDIKITGSESHILDRHDWFPTTPSALSSS